MNHDKNSPHQTSPSVSQVGRNVSKNQTTMTTLRRNYEQQVDVVESVRRAWEGDTAAGLKVAEELERQRLALVRQVLWQVWFA